MSFDNMKLEELNGVAAAFGADLAGAKTKAEIITALEEEGVTYEMYTHFLDAEKEEPEVEEKPKKTETKKSSKNTVLVKMERKNFSYQTYGYTFSAEHPYVAIPEEDAQLIFDNEEGFRMATPREVQEFYS